MDLDLRDRFTALWQEHFPGAELPITFFYSEDPRGCEPPRPDGHRCFISQLAAVRNGRTLCCDADAISCSGGKRYTGFSQELMPNFEHFLSCGIPGVVEGERYKQSPELVRTFMDDMPPQIAPTPFLLFKRWDALEEEDEPEAAIFFACPDVLAGLFTLANFDHPEHDGVICPFGAGCASIIQWPLREKTSGQPRAVLGMFDVSARPCVPQGTLSFAVPMAKFETMIGNMPESFLITPSWDRVRKRMK